MGLEIKEQHLAIAPYPLTGVRFLNATIVYRYSDFHISVDAGITTRITFLGGSTRIFNLCVVKGNDCVPMKPQHQYQFDGPAYVQQT
jgi:hypothetical protein